MVMMGLWEIGWARVIACGPCGGGLGNGKLLLGQIVDVFLLDCWAAQP